MSFWTKKSKIIITCAKGIPPFLKEEVLSLGLPILLEGIAGVETEGTMEDAIKLNLFLRTGHRILFLLEEFNAKAAAKNPLNGRIVATDISREAVEAAKKNATTAGVTHLMEFGICDYSETPVPEGSGVVVLNPEYGERLGKIEELKETYKGIGDFFKKRCQGYKGYIFTGNLDLAKKVGLRTKRRIPFFNGPIDCRLLEYDLYEGTRRKR